MFVSPLFGGSRGGGQATETVGVVARAMCAQMCVCNCVRVFLLLNQEQSKGWRPTSQLKQSGGEHTSCLYSAQALKGLRGCPPRLARAICLTPSIEQC